MMILIAVISLGVIGIIGALLLYWASKKFPASTKLVLPTTTNCLSLPTSDKSDV